MVLLGYFVLRDIDSGIFSDILSGRFITGAGLIGIGLFTWLNGARREAIEKRFRSPRHRSLWQGAEDRMKQFEAGLKKLRKERVADLQDLATNLRATAEALYYALRRADLLLDEIQGSEAVVHRRPPSIPLDSSDPQAQELYRIADRNIAEYRQRLATVMAGVQRTEAQAAVFSTTLDTLRVRMLGHRIVGRVQEAHQEDFLYALTEAKMQLSAIDQALEEIEMTPLPKSVVILPDRAESDSQVRQDA
jgi:hypothetical protein